MMAVEQVSAPFAAALCDPSWFPNWITLDDKTSRHRKWIHELATLVAFACSHYGWWVVPFYFAGKGSNYFGFRTEPLSKGDASLPVLDLELLRRANDNFERQSRLLGSGQFGVIYSGGLESLDAEMARKSRQEYRRTVSQNSVLHEDLKRTKILLVGSFKAVDGHVITKREASRKEEYILFSQRIRMFLSPGTLMGIPTYVASTQDSSCDAHVGKYKSPSSQWDTAVLMPRTLRAALKFGVVGASCDLAALLMKNVQRNAGLSRHIKLENLLDASFHAKLRDMTGLTKMFTDDGWLPHMAVYQVISSMAPADYLAALKDPELGQLGSNDTDRNGTPTITSPDEKGLHALGGPEHQSGFDSRVSDQGDGSRMVMEKTTATDTTAWLVASAAPHHATGNRALLSDYAPEQGDLFVQAADAESAAMRVLGRGNVKTEAVVLSDVWFVPGLRANMVSVSQLVELDLIVGFGHGKCYVRSSADGAVLGEARVGEDGLFAVEFLKVSLAAM